MGGGRRAWDIGHKDDRSFSSFLNLGGFQNRNFSYTSKIFKMTTGLAVMAEAGPLWLHSFRTATYVVYLRVCTSEYINNYIHLWKLIYAVDRIINFELR